MWENFKSFNCDAIVSVATHVLAVVRSHYPTIDLQSIGGWFAEGLSDVETQRLEDEVEDAAKTPAGDIDLFGETDGNVRTPSSRGARQRGRTLRASTMMPS